MASQDSTTTHHQDSASNPPSSDINSGNASSQASDPTDPPPDQTKPDAPSINPRLQALQTKLTSLTTTLGNLQSERATLAANAKLPSGLSLPSDLNPEETLAQALKSGNVVIKSHIAQLHAYNEIKDIGQGLMGLIAEKRGCRVGGVMEEFGMGEGD